MPISIRRFVSIVSIVASSFSVLVEGQSWSPEGKDRVNQAIVSIEVSSPQIRGDTRISIGSGFFVSSDGYIVTNRHVVQREAPGGLRLPYFPYYKGNFNVTLATNEQLSASLIYVDPKLDIALLKIDPSLVHSMKIIPLEFEEDTKIKVGLKVAAVGSPAQLKNSFSFGAISHTQRPMNFGDCYQYDAATNPGNSGGALIGLDSQKLIGMPTLIYRSSQLTEGLSFALKGSIIKEVVDTIMRHERPLRRFIPFNYNSVEGDDFRYQKLPLPVAKPTMTESLATPPPGALIVTRVYNKQASLFLKPGDILLSVNGREIGNSSYQLNRLIDSQQEALINLQVFRENKVINIQMPFDPIVENQNPGLIHVAGLLFYELSDQEKESQGWRSGSGLLMLNTMANEMPSDEDTVERFILKKWNGTPVNHLEDLWNILKKIPSGVEVQIDLETPLTAKQRRRALSIEDLGKDRIRAAYSSDTKKWNFEFAEVLPDHPPEDMASQITEEGRSSDDTGEKVSAEKATLNALVVDNLSDGKRGILVDPSGWVVRPIQKVAFGDAPLTEPVRLSTGQIVKGSRVYFNRRWGFEILKLKLENTQPLPSIDEALTHTEINRDGKSSKNDRVVWELNGGAFVVDVVAAPDQSQRKQFNIMTPPLPGQFRSTSTTGLYLTFDLSSMKWIGIGLPKPSEGGRSSVEGKNPLSLHVEAKDFLQFLGDCQSHSQRERSLPITFEAIDHSVLSSDGRERRTSLGGLVSFPRFTYAIRAVSDSRVEMLQVGDRVLAIEGVEREPISSLRPEELMGVISAWNQESLPLVVDRQGEIKSVSVPMPSISGNDSHRDIVSLGGSFFFDASALNLLNRSSVVDPGKVYFKTGDHYEEVVSFNGCPIQFVSDILTVVELQGDGLPIPVETQNEGALEATVLEFQRAYRGPSDYYRFQPADYSWKRRRIFADE